MSRTVRSDHLAEYELVIVREQGDRLAYEAHPSGQPAAVFLSRTLADSMVVFENAEHDFPQRIGYQLDLADSLMAWVEGTDNGQARRIDFMYRRAPCPGAKWRQIGGSVSSKDGMTRRMFLERAGLGALSAGVIARSRDTYAQIAVPNSAGTGPPALEAPPNACDCHMHIYDPARFPMPPSRRVAPARAAVPQYRLLQQRIGTTRVVIVTPRNYATDNAVTVDAIGQLAPHARGVAVLHPTVTAAEVNQLHGAGVRGIRFSLTDPATAVVTSDMIEPLAKRVADLGWHVQINMTADQIAAAETLWNRLPSPIVFDHIGHIPGPAGVGHPAYTVMRRLIDKGRTWVKLSVTYDNTTDGPPGYADVVRVGQALVKVAPQRLVWGSNWPHPNETEKPDDARLFDLMARWAPDGATRRRILVENPATLYEFGAA